MKCIKEKLLNQSTEAPTNIQQILSEFKLKINPLEVASATLAQEHISRGQKTNDINEKVIYCGNKYIHKYINNTFSIIHFK